jgi:hypothetical protein
MKGPKWQSFLSIYWKVYQNPTAKSLPKTVSFAYIIFLVAIR